MRIFFDDVVTTAVSDVKRIFLAIGFEIFSRRR
jgi:hypothetical protein